MQISALSAALEVGIRIAYLDRSEVLSGGDEVINWVEFGEAGEDERPLTLLYRYVPVRTPGAKAFWRI